MTSNHYYKNERANANQIRNARNCGMDCIVANGQTQSGKTSLAPLVQEITSENVFWTSTPSNNHLYYENERRIQEYNLRVACGKLQETLKDLETGRGEFLSRRYEFIFIDESHYGMGNDSELHKFLTTVLKNYESNGWRRPCFVFLGATNFQLQYELNQLSLPPWFGKCASIRLDAGEGYFGVDDMLSPNSLYTIFNPIPGMNKVGADGALHEMLLEELETLLSSEMVGEVHPTGLIRVAKNKKEGRELCHAIHREFRGKIKGFAVHEEQGLTSIREEFLKSMRSCYEIPTIVVSCRGMNLGIRLPDSIKPAVKLIIEDCNVSASEAQGLVGRMCGHVAPKCPVNLYANISTLHLVSDFAKDNRSLNDESLLEAGLLDKAIATHCHAKGTEVSSADEIKYFVIPFSGAKSYEVRAFVRDHFADLLAQAPSESLIHERYFNSPENDLQKILLESGIKGGGNRVTEFHNPDCKSHYPDSETELRAVISTSNHAFTKSLRDHTGLTAEELLKAFDEGRLYRLKVPVPIEEKASVTVTNTSFANNNEN